MRYLPLILGNLLRRKVRTTLTIGSFAVALFLFGLLAIIRTAFNQGVEVAGADRLVVRNKTSLVIPLPYAYKERLLQIRGVRNVTFATWFGGVYQDEKNFFPQFAIDSDTYLSMYPEFRVPKAQWEAFLKDKEGCIVGRQLVQKYGWKPGDRIPIKGTIWPGNWEFNVRGVYEGSRKEDDTTQFWIRYDYLEERRSLGKGTVGWYMVRVADPDEAVHVARAVDERFANSPYETVAETERAFAAGFVKQMGNIQLLILSIGGVVFFTLLLVTGNTMAMSVRERTGELGVMKALGFSNLSVLGLVLTESVVYALLGGGTGLAAVKLFSLRGDPTGGFLPLFYLAPDEMALGLGLTVVVGLAAGLIPAFMAMRLRVVDAVRRA